MKLRSFLVCARVSKKGRGWVSWQTWGCVFRAEHVKRRGGVGGLERFCHDEFKVGIPAGHQGLGQKMFGGVTVAMHS